MSAAFANWCFFGLIAFEFIGLSAAFFYGYKLRKELPAIFIGVLCLFPILTSARELKVLSRLPTTIFLALGMSIGLLGWVLLWVGGNKAKQ